MPPDILEQQGLGAAGPPPVSENGLPDIVDLTTPLANPQFEALRQRLQADYTRKTQEVAEQRRQLEQAAQQTHLAQQQAAAMMQQSSAQSAASAAPPEPVQQSLADELETHTGAEIDAGTRNLLNMIESRTQAPQAELNAKMDNLVQQMGQMAQAVNQSQLLLRTVSQRPEIETVTERFGREKIEPLMPDVAKIMEASPNLSFEQAVAAASPALVAETARAEAMESLQAKARQEQLQVSQMLGGLAGIESEPAGGANDQVPYDPKESMQQSMRAVMGGPAYREYLVQDALTAAGEQRNPALPSVPAGGPAPDYSGAFPPIEGPAPV